MPRLTIDSRPIEVAPGATILDAAGKLGIAIPTLCFFKGLRPNTSCFVCVVRRKGATRFIPACATEAEEGMEIESETPEVHEARRTALELLLGDHLGDCIAPCQSACPAGMNIPLMVRQIGAGRMREAIVTVKEHIALPAVLGRICLAPCEKACRRGDHDSPLALCLLKRYAADVDLASPEPYLPPRQPATGRKVAVAGAGPAGLTAAYYLLQEGYACVVFDDHPQPGGMLRYGVPESKLPRAVLDAEIRLIERLGAEFRMGTAIGERIGLADLKQDFDAVIVAVGELTPEKAECLGIRAESLEVNRKNFETSLAGVFAAGETVRKMRMAVRAVADGKAAAASVNQFLRNRPVVGIPRPFSTHIGKLAPEEISRMASLTSPEGRATSTGAEGALTPDEARRESPRCLHCDCRKQTNCRLRRWSETCGAQAGRFKLRHRAFDMRDDHPDIVYEPGKCIDCGLCVQIAAEEGDRPGLAFVGRGFPVRVGIPLGAPLADALRRSGRRCAEACPTGAISLNRGVAQSSPFGIHPSALL